MFFKGFWFKMILILSLVNYHNFPPMALGRKYGTEYNMVVKFATLILYAVVIVETVCLKFRKSSHKKITFHK